jgi:hypothetical protein
MYDKIRAATGFPLGIKRGEGKGLLIAEPSRRLQAVPPGDIAVPRRAVPPSCDAQPLCQQPLALMDCPRRTNCGALISDG